MGKFIWLPIYVPVLLWHAHPKCSPRQRFYSKRGLEYNQVVVDRYARKHTPQCMYILCERPGTYTSRVEKNTPERSHRSRAVIKFSRRLSYL